MIFSEERKTALEAAIKEQPSGYISRKIIKGRIYYYYQWKEEGKLKSRYLKAGERELLEKQILHRKQLQEELRAYSQGMRAERYISTFYLKQKMTIGYQSFEMLIQNQSFYVDKTDFIRQWWESGAYVTLITRPRRFGKTLNMSMTECFFSNRYEKREDLFEHLGIWKHREYRKLQGKYPVVFLSFAPVKPRNMEELVLAVGNEIRMGYEQYRFIVDNKSGDEISSSKPEKLSSEDRKLFEEIRYKLGQLDRKPEILFVEDALRRLCGFLKSYYRKDVLLLIDEYDTPLQEAYFGGFWEEAAAFMRNVFHYSLKANPYLEKALLTGITRITKESMFSDLNHLLVAGITSKEYADCFGFTEQEVFQALDSRNMGIGEIKKKVKEWYDGFCFGHLHDIYNPWSITNFLKTGEYRCWWVNSGANGLISELMAQGGPEVKYVLEDLLAGSSFETEITEEINFRQLKQSSDSVWSLLAAAGYLSIDEILSGEFSEDSLPGTVKCRLRPTNHEVVLMLRSLIKSWFEGARQDYNGFVRSLIQCDEEAMEAYLNRIALKTFSYFDTGEESGGSELPERFYHGFVLGLLVDMEERYMIRSNRESGFGRYDVMLIPRTTGDPAFILEFKVRNKLRETSLDQTLASALKQIETRRYVAELMDQNIPENDIHLFGLAFEGKHARVGQWGC